MHYYPDDIVLTAFQETLTDRYLLKTERKDADRIQMFFSYGHEQLPIIHGLNFLRLKTSGELRERAEKWSKVLYPVLLAGEVVFVVLLYLTTDFFTRKPMSTWGILIALVIFTLAAWWGAQSSHDWTSFIASGLSLISVVVLIFNGLFPRVMIATNNANSILIKNASSSPYTLHLMTILTFTILPIVLIYFIWSYWVFYKRIKSPKQVAE